MFIRISGQFTRILQLWMVQRGIQYPALKNRLAKMAERESIPVEQWRAVLAEAAACYPESHIGLEIGAQATLSHIGVLGYLVLNSETLVDALQTYQLCERRFYSVDFCRLIKTGNGYTLAWPDRLGEENALFVQVALASLVTFLRQRFPATCQLLQVELTESQPELIEPYLAFFGCPVQFGSTTPGITVSHATACQADTGALPLDFRSVRQQQAAAVGTVLVANDLFLQQLQAVLLKLIPESRVSLAHVAKEMDCSSRTLQRRLGNYHYSFQSLLDAVREQLGCRYLQEDGLTFVEIALLLGYSEQSAFTRAFKKWTGKTPGQYR
ncbi:AraC family transcriptional regulator [Seongchinamella sediminis]|nr:AraC family transcriptional regulator [Seongchinamella sediminis]